jgi:hypothetical protein
VPPAVGGSLSCATSGARAGVEIALGHHKCQRSWLSAITFQVFSSGHGCRWPRHLSRNDLQRQIVLAELALTYFTTQCHGMGLSRVDNPIPMEGDRQTDIRKGIRGSEKGDVWC